MDQKNMSVSASCHNSDISLYRSISARELPFMLRAAYEANGNDLEKASRDLDKMDMLLTVIRQRSLINARSRKAEVNRWSTNRNFQGIIENILLSDED